MSTEPGGRLSIRLSVAHQIRTCAACHFLCCRCHLFTAYMSLTRTFCHRKVLQSPTKQPRSAAPSVRGFGSPLTKRQTAGAVEATMAGKLRRLRLRLRKGGTGGAEDGAPATPATPSEGTPLSPPPR